MMSPLAYGSHETERENSKKRSKPRTRSGSQGKDSKESSFVEHDDCLFERKCFVNHKWNVNLSN